MNIHVPAQIDDDDYLALPQDAFEKWVKAFLTEIISSNWGYDGKIGEYGDMGLTPDLHSRIAMQIKDLARET